MNDQSINQSDPSTWVRDFEDIKQCWQNILFTIPGTFPLLPEFGCDLFKYIDKPITDSFGKVRNVIIAALERFEPRARIDKVTRTINGSQLLVNIEGTQINTNLPLTAQIDLSTGAETQLINYASIVPVTIVIGGSAEHDRLHNLSSLADHESVTGTDKGKILTTDESGAIDFSNVLDANL